MTTSRTCTTRSAEETEGLGERLALEIRAGDVVLLDAELAAGKTTLVRGLVAGFGGDRAVVSSPTFVLIQTYDCTGELIRSLHHVDLYRLGESTNDLRETGLEEALSDGTAVTAVEWPKNALTDWIPADARVWRIAITIDKGDARSIQIDAPAA